MAHLASVLLIIATFEIRNWFRVSPHSRPPWSEQLYTDLRWSMGAWLLQQRFDTHGKTSLGVPIAGLTG